MTTDGIVIYLTPDQVGHSNSDLCMAFGNYGTETMNCLQSSVHNGVKFQLLQ